MKKSLKYINNFTRWAQSNHSILALALVGSHAGNTARPDSDIDFVILCTDKSALLKDTSWVTAFGEVMSCNNEEWGVVTSLRVFYRDGQEVEFGIASQTWADMPVNPGTRRVVADGMVVLYDTDGRLARLKQAVAEDVGTD